MADLTTEIRCPKCNRKLSINVKEMVPGHAKYCTCGCEIRFSGDDGRKAQQALDDLERKLRRVSRQLRGR